MANESRWTSGRAPTGAQMVWAAFLGWLVPGLGHAVLGYPVRGCVLGVLLLGTFWYGEIISSGYAVTRQEHGIFFYGQIGGGLSALVADRLQWGDLPIAPSLNPGSHAIDRKIPTLLTTGILLTSVSGLLNFLLVLRILDPRSWEPAGGGPVDLGRAL
jgi:hypothetical protein